MKKCFHFVGLFVCLLTRLPKTLWMNVYGIFVKRRLGHKELIKFERSDPGILFLLPLFATCEIVLVYYCSLGVSTLLLTILVMSLVSMLCIGLTLQTKTFLGKGLNNSVRLFIFMKLYDDDDDDEDD